MDKILAILEHNAKATPAQVASMLGQSEEDVKKAIEEYEKEGIILGYKAIINWEKTQRENVTALIEVKVTPQYGMGFDSIAQEICKHTEVESIYLMSGGFDFTVIIAGRTMKEVARFVAEKLAPMKTVLSTGTHFVLKKYKEQGVEFSPDLRDERGVISW
ncbi:hypothetical protein SDC9_162354 [bioreactor metagenome]|uniref:Transcription regulator AsnC/Lrp ligand binding domain-containing protein n=1 Tax=bioreactor metagenome TaxID=1076179 RepID=A0A645FKV1_9ZZZZ